MDEKSESEKCFTLYLSLHCTSTSECSDHSLLLKCTSPTVRDVKEKIEEEFQIPKCLQELTLNRRSDFDDQSTLPSLYIPNRSIATVRYSSSAEVEVLGNLMKELTSLKETVSNLPPAGHLEWKSIENCLRQLQTASYTYLVPWTSSPSVDANRKFIMQERGIALVLDLLALMYPMSGGAPSTTTQVKMALAQCLLNFLCNFAESTESCTFVVEQGAAELFLRYLNLVSSDSGVRIPKMLYAVVIGCIAAYSEIESFQITLSSNQQVLHQLFKPTAQPPVDQVDLATQMSVCTLFFCLSLRKESHAHLISSPVVDDLLKFLDWTLLMPVHLIVDDLAMSMYVLTITVLRLLVLSPVNGIDPSQALVSRALAIMKKLVDFISPDVICRIEEEGYQWNHMFPFVEVAYGALHEAPCVRNNPQPITDEYLCLKVVLFSLQVLLSQEKNREHVRRQHLLDYFVCLNWHLPRAQGVNKDKYVEGLRLFYNDSPVEVPTLGNMARAKMAAHWAKLGLKKATTSTVQELAATFM